MRNGGEGQRRRERERESLPANPRQQSFLIPNAFGLDERAVSLSLLLSDEMEGPVGIVIARWIPVCPSLCLS